MCGLFESKSEPQVITQTTSNQPSAAVSYGQDEAKRIYQEQGPFEYYPDSTVVPFSPQSEQALAMTEQRALQGNPLLGVGQGAMMDSASGAYLNSNPYFDRAVSNALDPVQQRVNSMFAGSGRLGSGANTEVMTRELGNVAANMYANNYENERTRQMAAAAMAPQMAAADYDDYGRLAGVGAAREGMAQAQLQDEVNRFNFNQTRDYDALARYMGLVGGGYGTSSQSQPVFSNSAANFLGGAASGAGIGNMIGGGTGAAIGAGLGGLLGMF